MSKLTVCISDSDLSVLKNNKYMLCIACGEKTEGYDIICWADSSYLCSNCIEFDDEYNVFAAKSISENEVVNMSSVHDDMPKGGQIKYDANGIFVESMSGGIQDGFTIINEYDNIYFGYGRKIKVNGDNSVRPVFVSPYISVKGSTTMQPDDKVMVWFEQFVESGTYMKKYLTKVDASSSKSIEADLSGGDVEVTYENSEWTKN